jgi:hypothetical protein
MGSMLGQVTQVSNPTQQMMETFPMIMMMAVMAGMMGV